MTYMIVRMFDANRPNEIKKRGLTKEEAIAHVKGSKGKGRGWKDMFTSED